MLELLGKEDGQQNHRRDGHHGKAHDGILLRAHVIGNIVKRHVQRPQLLVLRNQPGPEEIVPVADEGLQGDEGNDGLGQRHADFAVQINVACAVNGSRFKIAAWYLVKKALVQIHIKTVGIEEGQQQGGVIVVSAQLAVHDQLWQHDAGKGHHHPSHEEQEHEVPGLPCEQAADDIGTDGAENHLGNHGEADDDDTVHDKGHESEPDDHLAFRIDVGRHLQIIFEALQIQQVIDLMAGAGECAGQGIFFCQDAGYLIEKSRLLCGHDIGPDAVCPEGTADGITGSDITVAVKKHLFFHGGAFVDAIVPFHLQLHLMRPGMEYGLSVLCGVHMDFHNGLIRHLVIDAEHGENAVLHYRVLQRGFIREIHAGIVEGYGEAVGPVGKQPGRNLINLAVILHGAGNGENQRIEHEGRKQQ